MGRLRQMFFNLFLRGRGLSGAELERAGGGAEPTARAPGGRTILRVGPLAAAPNPCAGVLPRPTPTGGARGTNGFGRRLVWASVLSSGSS